jgi:hypothetical protein
VTVGADGAIAVSVLGTTSYPSLAGKVVGDRLTLSGDCTDQASLSGIDLRIGSDYASFTGERSSVGNNWYCTYSIKGKKL